MFQEKDGAPGEIAYGPFVIAPAACTIASLERVVHLDPFAMDVLCVLAAEPGRDFDRGLIERLAWPRGGVEVAKPLSRLMAALDAFAPGALCISAGGASLSTNPVAADNVEQVRVARKPWISERWRPKSVHVLAASVVAVVLAIPFAAAFNAPVQTNKAVQAVSIVDDADDEYFQYTFDKNEQAIALYQRAIRRDSENARAYAGLANALVQRVMRWPQGKAEGAKSFTRLADALQAGFVDQPKAQFVLARAMRMAQRAVRLNPQDAAAHKALALVHSARREFDDALNAYKLSVGLDPDAWGPMINVGDILEIQGKTAEAVPYFEKAYLAMARVYGAQTVRVRPWHSELGIHIGDAYRARGELKQSAQWYRKVLDGAPLHPAATGRLVTVLQQAGDEKTARELCAALKSRLGDDADCRS